MKNRSPSITRTAKMCLTASVLLAELVTHSAFAQPDQKQMLAGMRPLCLRVPEKDVVRDMAQYSASPLDINKVCDCAEAKFQADPVFQRVASMSKAERQTMPKAKETSMYLSTTFYAGSMACYAEQLLNSAKNIDVSR
jgi:hypothetical protein